MLELTFEKPGNPQISTENCMKIEKNRQNDQINDQKLHESQRPLAIPGFPEEL